MIVFFELKFVFKDVVDDQKLGKRHRIDFFIPTLNLAMEYDGKYFHKEASDKRKNKLIKEKGWNLIRIREKPLKKTSRFDIIYNTSNHPKILMNNLYNKILLFNPNKKIKEKISYYLSSDKTLNDLRWREAIAKFPKPPKSKSLSFLFPEIAKLWDYEKNHPLTPDNYLATSRFRPWWKCNKCGYSFKATIDSKTRRINKYVETGGCKNCYGPLKAEAIRLSKLKKRGSIAKTHPKIAK